MKRKKDGVKGFLCYRFFVLLSILIYWYYWGKWWEWECPSKCKLRSFMLWVELSLI